MSRVTVRYAPSPTGVPHIGNIRTALFNFLFAKNQKGIFILRIEDTDRQRLMVDSIIKIKESLKILGLNWDGEEIYQSKRLDLYQKHLVILKKKQLTYNKEGAWYFKVKKGKKISWQDLLHGPIEFSSNVIDDFVIVKSDGFPTYHFASVVDDYLMRISHVIRGDEWISSTPKHLLLYEALNWQTPKFVHIPPILGSDKKKLAKRGGAKSVLEYIEEGYLPQALINFLVLLGWMPKGDREVFSLKDLVGEFSLERLNKNSPIFSLEKLNWFNKKYIQKLTAEELLEKLGTCGVSQVAAKRTPGVSKGKLIRIVNLVSDRLTTLADFDQVASIFFKKGKLKPPPKAKIKSAREAIESISEWTERSISAALDKWISDHHLEAADFKNILRLSIFADNTPPIYQSLAVLTKDEVLERIDDAINKSK